MADTPKRLHVNVGENTEQYVDLTPQEIAQLDQTRAEAEELRIKREADAIALETLKESAKAKLVAGEPLTEEEAATLII